MESEPARKKLGLKMLRENRHSKETFFCPNCNCTRYNRCGCTAKGRQTPYNQSRR